MCGFPIPVQNSDNVIICDGAYQCPLPVQLFERNIAPSVNSLSKNSPRDPAINNEIKFPSPVSAYISCTLMSPGNTGLTG